MKHNFLKLDVWKYSMDLVNDVYDITDSFPSTEKFALLTQIRRSAVSIPSNIAEGCGRNTNAQLVYFLNIGIGSLCELETQIYISHNRSYISDEQKEILINQLIKIRRMLNGFMAIYETKDTR